MAGPGHVFTPRLEALRPGDILLTRNARGEAAKGRLTSRAIEAASRGGFSHVLVCSGPPTFVEATPAGVMTLSLQRCFAHSLDNVRVLRHPDAAIAETAAALANRHVGRSYSVRKAAASIFPETMIGEIRDRGVFCSALAALVFAQAGAPEFRRRPPEKTTPATIERLEGLKDVTGAVFRRAPSPLNLAAFAALDGDRPAAPTERQTAILLKYRSALIPMVDEMFARFPRIVLAAPDSFLEIVIFLINACSLEAQAGSDEEAELRRLLSRLDEAAAALIALGELDAVAEEMGEIDAASLARALEESFRPRPDLDLEALRGLLDVTEQQLRARREEQQWLQAWGAGRSAAADAWFGVQARVIAHFERRAQVLTEVVARLAR